MSAMGILPISSIQKNVVCRDNSIVHTIENFYDLEWLKSNHKISNQITRFVNQVIIFQIKSLRDSIMIWICPPLVRDVIYGRPQMNLGWTLALAMPWRQHHKHWPIIKPISLQVSLADYGSATPTAIFNTSAINDLYIDNINRGRAEAFIGEWGLNWQEWESGFWAKLVSTRTSPSWLWLR